MRQVMCTLRTTENKSAVHLGFMMTRFLVDLAKKETSNRVLMQLRAILDVSIMHHKTIHNVPHIILQTVYLNDTQ
jgi:DMSO/TMAO reductase YedYZ heme-binding membrane subunit